MRKLVYVGYNRIEDEAVETTSYAVMQEYKAKGFVFHDRMDEIVKEREPLANYKARMAKRDEDIRKRRAEALV